jgi:aspartate kinase
VRVVVQKFGGSSLKDAASVMEAARKAVRTKRAGAGVVVVVSAQGRTTDDLIAKAHEISPDPHPREMDMLLATGEQQSIALTAMAVHELGERAVSLTGPQIGIVTDNRHRSARIKSIDTRRLVDALTTGQVVVLAGFQGMDDQYDITTLGRGGSDTTAVAVAAALKLAGHDVACEIYTDVDGVYTTDPRIVPDARKLDAVSYDEMLEMASLGAGVMHSRSIEFAKKFDVPLMVRNAASDAVGTWIVPEAPWMSDHPVGGAALAPSEARLVLERLPDRPGVSRQVFAALADAGVTVDMIAQSVGHDGRATIGFTVLSSQLGLTRETLLPIAADLGATVREGGRVSKVSVVGAGMRTAGGVAVTMFRALADLGVHPTMITTGDIKISVLIEEPGGEVDGDPGGLPGKAAHEEARKAVRGRRALRAVHAAFRLAEPRPGGYTASGPQPTPDAVARLDGMEDILVSGAQLDTAQSRVTVFDLADTADRVAAVFAAVAEAGILVDLIVHNRTAPGRAELSFTVPAADLPAAVARVRAVLAADPGVRVAGDDAVAVLYLLGVGMRTHTGVARTMFAALAGRGINIAMINTSEVCLAVAVERDRGADALAAVREAFKLA